MENSVDWSSLIGEVLLYALNQETYLKKHLDDRYLSIDTWLRNGAEKLCDR